MSSYRRLGGWTGSAAYPRRSAQPSPPVSESPPASPPTGSSGGRRVGVATAVAIATPFNLLGNKLWTFA